MESLFTLRSSRTAKRTPVLTATLLINVLYLDFIGMDDRLGSERATRAMASFDKL